MNLIYATVPEPVASTNEGLGKQSPTVPEMGFNVLDKNLEFVDFRQYNGLLCENLYE